MNFIAELYLISTIKITIIYNAANQLLTNFIILYYLNVNNAEIILEAFIKLIDKVGSKFDSLF